MSLGRVFLVGETDIFVARLGARDIPSITIGFSPPAGYSAPVTISGSGLPREAFFVMKMNGAGLLSQKNGIIFFFSTKEGGLNDIIVPNSNYYGAYSIELDEWVSAAPLATATFYVADTRNLQVLVAGPSNASPGDKVTWNLQLISPSGSLDQPGFSSTLSITKALLTSPTGSVQDLTASAVSTGPGSFSVSTTIPRDASQGTYALFVSASQTGVIVQSKGVGTAILTINNAQSVSSAPPTILGLSPVLFYGSVGGLVAAIVIAFLGTMLALRQREKRRRAEKIETPASPTTGPVPESGTAP